MKKNKKNKNVNLLYRDEPIQLGKRLVDFLPSPDELLLKDDTVKVTIALTRRSIDFFKHKAIAHSTKYQRLIRRLLDEYVMRNQRITSS